MAPSPMTATTRRSSPLRCARRCAMPSAALIEVLAVADAEGVVLALVAARETARGRRAGAACCMRVAPPGQHLVRIGLVADIPDQPVVRRVEHVVQRHGQLDRAQIGGKMTAVSAQASGSRKSAAPPASAASASSGGRAGPSDRRCWPEAGIAADVHVRGARIPRPGFRPGAVKIYRLSGDIGLSMPEAPLAGFQWSRARCIGPAAQALCLLSQPADRPQAVIAATLRVRPHPDRRLG